MPSNRTIESIRLQSRDTLERSTVFDCGCHLRHVDERWSLCVYHEGYDDASEKTDELQGLIDALAEAHAQVQSTDAALSAGHGPEGARDRVLAWEQAHHSLDRAAAALLAAATPQEDDR